MIMGQMITPPIATLRIIRVLRCAFSCARRCSGVRIVGCGCAMVVGMGVKAWRVIMEVCACKSGVRARSDRYQGRVTTCLRL